MTPEQLRDLAHAVDLLAKIRQDCGVAPGPSWDRTRIHIVGTDVTWELQWVADAEDSTKGHYDAELERA